MGQGASGGGLTKVECPACGGPLDIPEGAALVTCEYCGSSIRVREPERHDMPRNIGPDGAIRDPATGMGLFKVDVPDDWSCISASVTQTATTSQPLVPRAILRGPGGAMAEVELGEAGDALDGPTKALLAMGGRHLAGIDRTNYAEMPDPVALARHLAEAKAAEAGLSLTREHGLEEPPLERLEGVRQVALRQGQEAGRRAGGMVTDDALCAEVIRRYDAEADGQPWGMAVAVRLVASRYGLGGMGAQVGDMMGGLGSMVGGFGDMLRGAFGQASGGVPSQQQGGGAMRSAGSFLMGGGLIGQRMRQGQQTQQPQGVPGWDASDGEGFDDWSPSGQAAPQASPAAGVTWCVPDIAAFASHGNISWEVSVMMVMIAPMDVFGREYEGTFLHMLGTTGVHPDVVSQKARAVAAQHGQMQQATGAAIAQNQQMTQATLAAARERNAAFQSYNDAWSARSDARHASFRAASNARFSGSPSGGGRAGDFSEAIRGVNTFVTSDGREVELSVASDVAYENKAGDVVGGGHGFDPGADWTQIPRR